MRRRICSTVLFSLLPLAAAGCGGSASEDIGSTDDALAGLKVRVAVGVHEHNPAAFDPGGHWKELGVHRARIIVSWNVADVPERRAAFDAWITAARAAHVEPYVVFEPFEGPENPDAKAPRAWPMKGETALDFSTTFRHFREAWPDVKLFAGWNEPNNPHYIALTPSGAALNDASCKGTAIDSCGPHLVAKYYLAMKEQCPDCELVAGELLGAATEYADKYRQMLGSHVPAIWGMHNYGDVTIFTHFNSDQCKPGHSCEVRDVLQWFNSGRGDWPKTQLWITEVSPYYNEFDGATQTQTFDGEASQARTVKFLLNLGHLDNRLTRIYFFSYFGVCTGEAGCRWPDSGLVSGGSGFRQRRRAFDVIANRVFQP
jgi:hypothetical protein